MINFIKYYIKSMRLYYSFVTGIPGWIGVSFYEHISKNFNTIEVIPSTEKKFVILLLLFLSWGINQIINDYLGLEEDKINAPNRPMVTGDLPAKKALVVSAALIVITGIIINFYLEPIAMIPLILGVIFNIVYEFAKGYGIWGNITFGIMMSMCPIFGYLACGPVSKPYFTYSRMSVLFLIFIINALMTYFTYFKDYKGDKAAGKKTIIVEYGLTKGRIIGVIGSFLPIIVFMFIYSNDLIVARVNNTFILLGIITVFLHILTGILYYKNPVGEKTYYCLSVNFRACVCAQAALIALFNQRLSVILFIISYILVGYLFSLYSDVKG